MEGRFGIDMAAGDDRTVTWIRRGGEFVCELPATTDPTLWRLFTVGGLTMAAHPECEPVMVPHGR
jgi:hypothetical protein